MSAVLSRIRRVAHTVLSSSHPDRLLRQTPTVAAHVCTIAHRNIISSSICHTHTRNIPSVAITPHGCVFRLFKPSAVSTPLSAHQVLTCQSNTYCACVRTGLCPLPMPAASQTVPRRAHQRLCSLRILILDSFVTHGRGPTNARAFCSAAEWLTSMMDSLLFPIAHSGFWTLFHRACLTRPVNVSRATSNLIISCHYISRLSFHHRISLVFVPSLLAYLNTPRHANRAQPGVRPVYVSDAPLRLACGRLRTSTYNMFVADKDEPLRHFLYSRS